MKKIISLLTMFFPLLFIATLAQSESVQYSAFKADIHYSLGKLTAINIFPTAKVVFPPKSDLNGNYFYKIISFKNKILETKNFTIPLLVFYDTVDPQTGKFGGGSYELNETEFTLLTPYYPNAKSIEIYDKNQTLLLSMDVSPYSQCNENSVCEVGESNETCSSDCKSGGQIGWGVFFPMEILAGMVIIILAAAFFLLRKKSIPQAEPANL